MKRQRCESGYAWFGDCDIQTKEGYYKTGVTIAIATNITVLENDDRVPMCESCSNCYQMDAEEKGIILTVESLKKDLYY